MANRTKKGNVTSTARKKYGEKEGSHKGAFPIFDKKSAEAALHLIGHAHSEAEKASIIRRAAKYGVHPK